jgi:hypothetical protein
VGSSRLKTRSRKSRTSRGIRARTENASFDSLSFEREVVRGIVSISTGGGAKYGDTGMPPSCSPSSWPWPSS